MKVDMNLREAMNAIFSAPGEGPALWFRDARVTLRATGASTGGAYALWETVAPPGDSPPLHVHHREEESFFVLEGMLTFRCGERTFSATPGSFVLLPRAVPHTFLVHGPGNARVIGLMTPGGGEQFFVAGGRPAAGDGLPPKSPPDLELLRRAFAKYGQEIVGPPLGR
jgi:mannose-6-phosphate isomerase-like protein (cupin superfamily)